MYIVFLNMADQEGSLTAKSVQNLRKKYPPYRGYNPFKYLFYNNTIEEINLIPLYRRIKSKRIDFSALAEILNIAVSCEVADKIMLGIHGHFDDVNCGYIGKFGDRSDRITFRELAQFLLRFLVNRAERYHLSLIMCFGARSQDYKFNHEKRLAERMVKSSFAYKFYKEICVYRNVLMTARTGAVSFSDHNGRSLVQTEAAVSKEMEYSQLQKAGSTARAKSRYDELFEKYFKRDGNVKRVHQMEELVVQQMKKGRVNWSTAPAEQKTIAEYYKMKETVTRLTQQKGADKSKYGKFVYYYDKAKNIITVYRKYPATAVLYKGRL